ncbi:MlaD family protein [Desulfocicer vacuolatum]|uniref:MlaD family protein n=1 Tax=Desulfocicer vacuolatum TaxID=2298 RepID=UPI001BAE7C3D|nr:MlaD family protein [Desulfocicer vacuolatum]
MKNNVYESIAGVFVFVGLMVLVYMTVNLGNLSLFGDNFMVLKARFNTVTGLRAGNPIEMYGIEIGHVGSLSIDDEVQMAVATLNIQKSARIYSDAIASIKTAGLIGDKFISIDPGGSGEILGNNGVIINTESPVDINDLIGKYAFGSVDEEDEMDFGEEIQ